MTWKSFIREKLPVSESDPSGKDQHEAGAKLDAGKIRPALVLGGFADALMAVAEIGTLGAAKYTENGWKEVDNGEARYDDAHMRHWLKQHMGEDYDPDWDTLHLAHEAWNTLARLQFVLEKNKEMKGGDSITKEPGHGAG